jgi:hypothetical protein
MGSSTRREDGSVRFVPVLGPSDAEVEAICDQVARRVLRLAASAEDELSEDDAPDENALCPTLPLALPPGPALLPRAEWEHPEKTPRLSPPRCAQVEGFSLHANTAVHALDRRGLERLCRYGLRSSFALSRLSEREDGRLAYKLKRPWPDGRTELSLEPLELVRRLALLIPPARSHTVRYHGAFAPASPIRSAIRPRLLRQPERCCTSRPAKPAATGREVEPAMERPVDAVANTREAGEDSAAGSLADVDSFTRHSGSDSFTRHSGSDSFTRHSGSDSFTRHSGSDSFTRHSGSDSFTRHSGSDSFTRHSGSDSFTRHSGSDSFTRHSGSDSFTRHSGSDSFTRHSGSDSFTRHSGSDSFTRHSGSDSFTRHSGSDSFTRHSGSDSFTRHSGSDSFTRHSGSDSFTRHSGSDSFTRHSGSDPELLLTVLGEVPDEASLLPVRQRRLHWAALLRRVFAIDVLRCARCQGWMTVLAAINDPGVAQKILRHLGLPTDGPRCAPARAPPDLELDFDDDLEPDAGFAHDVEPDDGFDPDVDVDPDFAD